MALIPLWLWLWHRPAAAAPIWPLAWEPPYAVGVVLKRAPPKEKQSLQGMGLGIIVFKSSPGDARVQPRIGTPEGKAQDWMNPQQISISSYSLLMKSSPIGTQTYHWKEFTGPLHPSRCFEGKEAETGMNSEASTVTELNVRLGSWYSFYNSELSSLAELVRKWGVRWG